MFHLRRRTLIKAGCIAALLVYASLCTGFYALQDRRLFPGRRTQGQASAVIRPTDEAELMSFETADHIPIVARFGRATSADGHVLLPAAARPTVIYFYGNSMSAADCNAEFDRLRRLGFNVLIPDYSGFGMSSGNASEYSLYSCAEAAFDAVAKRADVDPTQIVAAGWSLGAAVACDLATKRPVIALMMFSGFTSWTEETHEHFWWLPTSLLLTSRFDSECKLERIHCPHLLAHGRHDSIVPRRMLDELVGVNPCCCEAIEVDSDHADIFEKGGVDLDQKINSFVRTAITTK